MAPYAAPTVVLTVNLTDSRGVADVLTAVEREGKQVGDEEELLSRRHLAHVSTLHDSIRWLPQRFARRQARHPMESYSR